MSTSRNSIWDVTKYPVSMCICVCLLGQLLLMYRYVVPLYPAHMLLPRCIVCTRSFLWAFVCPSVCPSVKRSHCDKTKQISCDILIPYERSIHLVFHHEEWLVGGRPLVPEILGQTDPTASTTAISNQYSLVAPQPFDLAKKSSIITNRKSTRSFPMSL